MMWPSVQRDSRFASHSAIAVAGKAWRDDAKIAGRAEEVADPPAMLATGQRYVAGEAADVPVGSSRWLLAARQMPSSEFASI
jgi:hypothetical protein